MPAGEPPEAAATPVAPDSEDDDGADEAALLTSVASLTEQMNKPLTSAYVIWFKLLRILDSEIVLGESLQDSLRAAFAAA